MTNGYVFAYRQWIAGVGVEYAAFLQIAIVANDEWLGVTAQGGAKPYTDVRAQMDFADDGG